MMISIERTFAQVHALIERADYAEAEKLLAPVRSECKTRRDATSLSEMYFCYGRCYYYTGRYTKALARLRAAVRLCQDSANHRLFAREKVLLGVIMRSQGRQRDAVEAFTEAFAARKRARDYDGLFVPLVHLALSHFLGGDLHQARSVIGEALSYTLKYNGVSDLRLCLLNRFLFEMFSGELAKCQETLAEVRLQELGVVDSAHVSLHSGQLFLFRMQSAEASALIKEAMNTYARNQIRRDYVVCLEFLGMNEYFAGNYKKAKAYYQQVLEMPEPTASAVAQTLRMLADVYIAEGNWQKATETAAKAEQAITKINERIELGALWRALAQIAEHDGDAAAARES